MLRGAIDYFDGHVLGGWVYSSTGPLRDRTVLAFVDDACVGAGEIDKFRQDLADVGLGDGYCGFTFAISPPPETPRARIVVKLEGSDFALLDRGAKVVDPIEEAARSAGYSIDSIAWMRERKWLDAAEYGFLRDLTDAGVHDRSLHALTGLLSPTAEAKQLLSLYCRSPVRIQEALIDLRNLADERAALIDGAATPIIAIHTPHGSIRREQDDRDGDPTIATVRHACRPDRLLFIDAHAPFVGDGTETARVFRAV